MLKRRPVVFGEDCEQAGAVGVDAEVVLIVEAQLAVAVVTGE